jgi:hypothetical protein
MIAWTLVPLTCWLCALMARPARPLPGSEVQELVYTRLMGRQQRLMLLACTATVLLILGMVLMLPQRVDADLRAVRQANADCAARIDEDAPLEPSSRCYVLEAGGTWEQERRRADGGWERMGTVAAPVALDTTIHGSKP